MRIELALLAGLYAGALHAAHPLITEDAATLGAGGMQVELSAERADDTQPGILASVGVAESLDVVVGHPRHDGDATLDVKWRFYRNGAASLALKPGLTVPAGDPERESGGAAYGAFLIASHEREAWSTHWHAGYKADAAELVHLSAAAVYQASERLKLAADLGMDTDLRLSTTARPAWLLLGTIYSPRPKLDLDLGCRHGLNAASEQDALLVGLTVRW